MNLIGFGANRFGDIVEFIMLAFYDVVSNILAQRHSVTQSLFSLHLCFFHLIDQSGKITAKLFWFCSELFILIDTLCAATSLC